MYPAAAQRMVFVRNFGCVRWTYNNALAYCKAQYEAHEKYPGHFDLTKRLKGLKQAKAGQWNPTSTTCSECGVRAGLALAEHRWTCTCGATHDRDINAARNIAKFALDLGAK